MTAGGGTAAAGPGHAVRTFVLGQWIRYDYSGPVTDLRQRLMTIPPPAHGGQSRRRWRLTVGAAGAADTRIRLDQFENLLVEASVARVDGAVDFVVDVEVEVVREGVAHHISADPRHLRHTRLTAPDPAIAELAGRARSDDVGALCARVHRALDYEWGVTGVGTPASEALAAGRGVCQDYAHIMLAACRYAGIAARYVSGHIPGEGGSHAWVEVLHPDRRSGTWIVEGWDPTLNRRVTPDYLVIAVGRDYDDVAPLSGTYCGTGVTGTLTVDKRLSVN